MSETRIPPAKDKPLFTPGPLTTSMTVKQAMLRDLGSRDFEFIRTVREIREKLLRTAGVSKESGYEAVLLQGSGTYGIEAVITCAVPRAGGKWLFVINGAYGDRMASIAGVHGIDHADLKYPENLPPVPADIDEKLRSDPAITAVAVVHCETTTGIINPIREIGEVVRRHGRTYFVDSMSAFGAVPFDFDACGIDFLVSSSNKCVEGVPGFCFVICRRESLLNTKGWSRTLCLDLLGQWQGLEKNGQFRFTPPTHALLAFNRALDELEMEGGAKGRAARYAANYRVLTDGMRRMGFEEYLPPELQGHIITSFRYPKHPRFDFEAFYSRLNDLGFVIYPGKVSNAECFRIGTIGRIFEGDMRAALRAIEQTVADMGVILPKK
ncbi:MAG TPA: 2-aminoethylphosphonate--pyruvate transaminase [Candidatus Brocadiia bacterium]|nr:2-aminoethylphosphonate--pyruvate transaminase [Candidatus Brocadiia bacterium]